MKACKQCGIEKPLDQYSPNAKCKGGRAPRCKACYALNLREKRKANPEKFRAKERARYATDSSGKKRAIRKYYKANAERRKEDMRLRYAEQAERIKEQAYSYRRQNKHLVRTWNGTRRATQKTATPKWADREKIAEIYAEASRLWAETGIPHHVDHVIPLKNGLVCGLHVETNLQILTEQENLRKGNRFQA